MAIADEKILIIDGAMGSNLASLELAPDAWGDRYEGYTEYLNLSSGKSVIELHRSFLDAGARVLTTNSFGANRIVAQEYGLEDKIDELNRLAVEHARAAIGGRAGCYVTGSMGPTTKLPSLGHIEARDMASAFREQARSLISAGVDAISIETCQDLLQMKTCLVAVLETMQELDRQVPVMAFATIEQTGTMLIGTSIDAIVTTLSPFPLFSLGLNCATGPTEMLPHIRYLSRHFPGRIAVMPNAGIPEIQNGVAHFPLKPEPFARHLLDFVTRDGASIVGGCCGTTPEHIRMLARALGEHSPASRDPKPSPRVASLYRSEECRQEIPPLVIGERMNANGSKKFRQLLLAEDFQAAAEMGCQQENRGAHLLDLSTAYAGRDETADMLAMIKRLRSEARAPLVIDSTTPATIEAALAEYPGRAVINSINLEDGGATLDNICRIAKKHGAAVMALTIGPNGMALTLEDKLKVARAIYERVLTNGLRGSDIFFDMLTFTIGSGDPTLKDAAAATLEAIRQIKREFPEVMTSLGVSNISFGLPKQSRQVLNSMFLHEAIGAGLDAAIVDAGNILPIAQISQEKRQLCLDLIYNRQGDESDSPLDRFIQAFSDSSQITEEKTVGTIAPEKQLEDQLQSGVAKNLEDTITVLLERYRPLDIINQILIPAMRRIGELFGRGEMLLPFVLKSAEVMKKSVAILEPLMEKREGDTKTKILLATVKGDVHDIGKNLVDIILSNNGYDVVNLGTNIPIETIIREAVEQKVDAVGLSGLLVKSAIVMQESMPLFERECPELPILLGGAALTARFVAESCAQDKTSPVVYCADAFAGLKAMQELEAGTLRSTPRPAPKGSKLVVANDAQYALSRNNSVPTPPFWGTRHVENIAVSELFEKINIQALFRGRWGFRKSSKSTEEYRELLEREAVPVFESLKDRIASENWAHPKVAYGYFPGYKQGDTLMIDHAGEWLKLDFPRQSYGARLCIADYFKTQDEGGDVVGFFVASLGNRIVEETKRLYEQDKYHDYLMLHGFAVELTDALAEHWHARIRQELGIEHEAPAGTPACSCQGSRYGFGYPSCPDLGAHKVVFRLLEPEIIGVTLTETMEMVPEVSTSAIVVHHPEATYFSV